MGWLFIFLYLLYVWLNKTGKRGQNKAVMATLALSILLWGSSPGGAQCSQLQQLVIGSQLRNVEMECRDPQFWLNTLFPSYNEYLHNIHIYISLLNCESYFEQQQQQLSLMI